MVMQIIYSPIRFYLTFSHVDSWNFNWILNAITLTCFFFLNHVKPFLPAVNKCTVTILIIVTIINVKNFQERRFCGISINSLQ